MRWLVPIVFVVGCGAKAKPAPPPAELEVTGVASIAGAWVADDEMAWSYALAIAADGALVGRVDRGKLPRCDREGTLAPAATPRTFTLALRKNTCEAANANAGTATLEVASFTGDALTIVITIDGTVERRTYTRRPK